MRKIDSFLVLLIAATAGGLAYSFNLDYGQIASDSLTVISIILAIYMASIGGLMSSPLSARMKSIPDNQQSYRSQLGRLVSYFKWAVFDSIITIILTSIFRLLPTPTPPLPEWYCVLSAVCIAAFASNFVFTTIVFLFILNRQVWESQ